jgi:DNA-binding transcriptional regulator of glucitol operon
MRSRWLSKKALALHLVILIWVPGCLVAGWWQVTVALSGNDLGYLYSVEWPVFAIFGIIAWWHALHDDESKEGSSAWQRARYRRAVSAQRREQLVMRRSEDEEPELAAYNDYLASLAEKDQPKTWRRS